MIWTIPNILTVFRILLVPILIITFYIPFPNHHIVSAMIFLLGSLTDWLDGFWARYFKRTTKLGAFLDPVADKLMVSTALVLIISHYPYAWVAIPAAIIIAREIIVSALREWMAALGKRGVVQVSFIGKIKTSSQMSAIFLLLLSNPSSNTIGFWIILAFLLLYMAVILTVYSMWIYLSFSYSALREKFKL